MHFIATGVLVALAALGPQSLSTGRLPGVFGVSMPQLRLTGTAA